MKEGKGRERGMLWNLLNPSLKLKFINILKIRRQLAINT